MYKKYKNLMWVKLKDTDDFLKIAETLTRIGIEQTDENGRNVIEQQCYILHSNNRYAIAHYKELMYIDDEINQTDISYQDIEYANFITDVLIQWGLCTIDKDETIRHQMFDPDIGYDIKILKFSDKSNWILKSPYDIGKNE